MAFRKYSESTNSLCGNFRLSIKSQDCQEETSVPRTEKSQLREIMLLMSLKSTKRDEKNYFHSFVRKSRFFSNIHKIIIILVLFVFSPISAIQSRLGIRNYEGT
jgi:hypothetical protein